jgi:hypothetical protein
MGRGAAGKSQAFAFGAQGRPQLVDKPSGACELRGKPGRQRGMRSAYGGATRWTARGAPQEFRLSQTLAPRTRTGRPVGDAGPKTGLDFPR